MLRYYSNLGMTKSGMMSVFYILRSYTSKKGLQMTTEEIKGLIFLLLMVPVGIRYFIKTGNKDTSFNKVDYAIVVGIIIVIILINL